MWDKRVYSVGEADLLACAVDAHVREIAMAMGLDDSWRGSVMWGEAYTIGKLTVMYVGQRSGITGELRHGMRCVTRLEQGELQEVGAA